MTNDGSNFEAMMLNRHLDRAEYDAAEVEAWNDELPGWEDMSRDPEDRNLISADLVKLD